MAGHTPGPWKVGGVDDAMWVERPNPADSCVCDIVPSLYIATKDGGDMWLTSEDEANARLIAAAPDLLAALKALCDSRNDDEESHAMWAAEVAIAKAEDPS